MKENLVGKFIIAFCEDSYAVNLTGEVLNYEDGVFLTSTFDLTNPQVRVLEYGPIPASRAHSSYRFFFFKTLDELSAFAEKLKALQQVDVAQGSISISSLLLKLKASEVV